MLGLLLNEREHQEVIYLIKRELEELLLDLGDHRIDHSVKEAMVKRYQVLFNIFKRVADQEECLEYILQMNVERN